MTPGETVRCLLSLHLSRNISIVDAVAKIERRCRLNSTKRAAWELLPGKQAFCHCQYGVIDSTILAIENILLSGQAFAISHSAMRATKQAVPTAWQPGCRQQR